MATVQQLQPALAAAQAARDAAAALSTPVVTPPASGMPAWRRGLAKDVLAPIPGTQTNIIPALAVDCYTGACITDDSILYGPVSGHWSNATFDNAVRRALLALDAPIVRVDCDRTPAALVPPITTSTFYYGDNKPVPRQSYNTQWFCAGKFCPDGKDRMFLVTTPVCAVPTSMNPYYGYKVDGYRIADRAWDAPGTWDDVPFGGAGYASWSMGRDPQDGSIYYANGNWGPNSKMGRFNPMAPKGSQHTIVVGPYGGSSGTPGNFTGWQFNTFAKDSLRNRLFAITGVGTGTINWLNWIDLATGKFAYVVADATVPRISDSSVHYDRWNDRYLFTNGNDARIWSLPADIKAGSPAPSATVLATAPSHALRGINNRFGPLDALEGFAFHATAADPIMFLPCTTR